MLFGLDVLLLAITWPLALWATRPDLAALFDPATDTRGFVYPCTNLLALYALGSYRRDAIQDPGRSLARLPMIVGLGAVLAALVSALIPPLVTPLPWHGGRDEASVFAFAILLFLLCALLARLGVDVMLRRGVLRRRLLVIGAGERAWDLRCMLRREGGSPDYDIAFLHDPALGSVDPRLAADPNCQVVTVAGFRVLDTALDLKPDQIVVAPDDRRGMNLERLLECKRTGYPVVQYLSFIEKEIRRIDLRRMEMSWLLFTDGFSFGVLDRLLKRAFDLVASAAVLLLSFPLLLGAMVAIRWEGAGPVLYCQDRVTQDGRVFRILKLRTMRVDAEATGAAWAGTRDSRITRVGAWLRRTRIDELPQLLNVLKGDMSFVGPRPERPVFVASLAEQIPLYQERHMVKAGLTGWAQINYPYGSSVDDARSKLSYDLYYVKNFSILFDFVILVQTIRVVFWPQGVR